ncbi:DNA cytosine methyltransferase [Pseudomonas sp. P105]|uniref:DNA cytosine methyltransferase n=1 Tax=Pseudomonas sp. P105 TaxID=3049542 RepID=UPI00293466C3|nr:DNA cytosine methyltransferase [Pseudomonas sp. P105]WNZ80275.1 DNA cytosine methyltransferase [Pseudomonas sp. P105]
MTVTAVDLFCGAGGLTRGLKNSGINVTYGVDFDQACRYAYEKNNADSVFIGKSVTEITSTEINGWLGNGDLKLLAGCAPCQPFSKYSSTRKTDDDKWMLLREFQRLILECKPELVTMENVPQLRTHSVYLKFVKTLILEGYKVDYRVVSCAEYGLHQLRKRLVLVASRLGQIKIAPPKLTPEQFNTVRSAIGHLPPLEAGERHTDDSLHYAASLNPMNLQRIKCSIPGGTWRDWPESLRAACHAKASGSTYASVYGRMQWEKPSPTITTQSYGYGTGRFGHPEQDRALSLREMAILQSFPDDYEFFEPGTEISTRTIGTMIGNAVPVRLGEVIGETFMQHLRDLNMLPPPSNTPSEK